MLIRRTALIRDRTETDKRGVVCRPLTRVVAMAALRNPVADPGRRRCHANTNALHRE